MIQMILFSDFVYLLHHRAIHT